MNQDKDFETYMQGKSDLSRAYAELPETEVPDHLDAAILAEAHRAVGARPGGKNTRRWAVPLGMVASLFVVVMIGLQMPYLLQDAAQPTLPKEEAAPVFQQDKSVAAPAAMAPKAEAFAPRAEPVVSGNISLAPALENTAPVALKEQAVELQEAAKRSRSDSLMDSANEIAPSKKKQAAGIAEGVLSKRVEPGAPAAASVAAPEPVQNARESLQLMKGELGAASSTYSNPENWLARIKQLKQQGKLDEAKKELAAFKKRYPDYPVPGELEIK